MLKIKKYSAHRENFKRSSEMRVTSVVWGAGARLAIAALLLLIMAGAVSATTYYVNNSWGSASDTNTGLADTNTSAWLTISKAVRTMTSGDTTYVMSGSYDETGNTEFANSGTELNWIKLLAENGKVYVYKTGCSVGVLTMAGNGYINITGDFEFDGQGNCNAPIRFDGTNNITLKNIKAHDGYDSSIYFKGWIAPWNYNKDITIDNVTVWASNQTYSHGITIHGHPYETAYSSGITIRNSTIHSTKHNGIDIHTSASNVTVDNNTVYNVTGNTGILSHNYNNSYITISNNNISNANVSISITGTSHGVIKNNTITQYTSDMFKDTGIEILSTTCTDGVGLDCTPIINLTVQDNIIISQDPNYVDISIYSNHTTLYHQNILLINNSLSDEYKFSTQTPGSVVNVSNITIRNPYNKTTKIVFAASSPVYNSSIEFTDGRIFTDDSSNVGFWSNTLSNFSLTGLSGTVLITKYNSTLNTTGNLSVTGFTSSSMVINHYNRSISRTNFTLSSLDSISNLNITVDNAVSGNTYNLKYYGNGTQISSQTAASTIYFNNSLGADTYYLEESAGCGNIDTNNVYASPDGTGISGTLTCPSNITQAYSNVTVGGTIWLINGTYYNESIAVSKAVSFEKYNGTVVFDNVTGISGITAFTVTSIGGGANFSNFTIQNYKTAVSASGASVLATLNYLIINTSGSASHSIVTGSSANVVIRNSNITTYNGNAIRLWTGSGTSNILNNVTLNCKDTSANDWFCLANRVAGTRVDNTTVTFVDNTAAVYSNTNNNVFKDMNITISADSATAIGMNLENNNNNTLNNITVTSTGTSGRTFVITTSNSNTFQNLTSRGISGGIVFNNLDNSTIKDVYSNLSRPTGSNIHGIWMHTGSDYNIIQNWTGETNYTSGSSYGITFSESNHNVITNITGKAQEDLGLKWQDSTNNTITYAYGYGGIRGVNKSVGGRGIRVDNMTSSGYTNLTGVSYNGNAGISFGVVSPGSNAITVINATGNSTNISSSTGMSSGFEISYINNSNFTNITGISIDVAGILINNNASGNTIYNFTGSTQQDIGGFGFVGLDVQSSGAVTNTILNLSSQQRIRMFDTNPTLVFNFDYVHNESSSKSSFCGVQCNMTTIGTLEAFDIIPFRNLSIVATNSTVVVNDNTGANFTVTNNEATVSQVTYRNVANNLYYNLRNTTTIKTAQASSNNVSFNSLSLADGVYTISQDTLTPASITSLTNTTGNFWHNWTWTNPTDSDFNHTMIYINGTFVTNTSNQFYNLTANAHNTSTLNTHTVDTAGNVNTTWGNLTSVIPNNPPVLSSIGNKVVDENQWLNFTLSSTDLDNDIISYLTNATKGVLNSVSGLFSWLVSYTDSGIYSWFFNATDVWGGEDNETISITVNNVPLSITSKTPSSDPSSSQGTIQNFTVNINRTANVTWLINGTSVQTNSSVTTATYINSTAPVLSSYNVTASVTDSTDTISAMWNWTITTSPTSNTTPSITNIVNGTVSATSGLINFTVNQSNALTHVKYSNYSNMSSSSQTVNDTSSADRSVNITGLNNNTSYYYSVYAFNASNTSLWTNSTVQNFTTVNNATLPSSGTSGIENINSSVTRYTVYWQWDNPTEASYNTTRIYINGEFITNKTIANYLLENLQPQTTHTLSLRSVNTTGENITWVNNTAATLNPDTGGGGGGGGGGSSYIYSPNQTNATNITTDLAKTPLSTQITITEKQPLQLSDVSKRQLLFGSAIALLLFSIYIFIKPRR